MTFIEAEVLEEVQRARDKIARDFAEDYPLNRLVSFEKYEEKRLLEMNIRNSEFETLPQDNRPFKERVAEFDNLTS